MNMILQLSTHYTDPKPSNSPPPKKFQHLELTNNHGYSSQTMQCISTIGYLSNICAS